MCKQSQHLSPELLFGDALYNYFSVWVPENYPALKPILWFFPKGDKKLGLQQLKEVSYNAFYTRTEAMVWLMRILNNYENDNLRAFQISEYLYQTYPDNPFFHRYYARMLYAMGKFAQAEPVCKEILARIDSGMIGYEFNTGRYAAFFWARFMKRAGNWKSRANITNCVWIMPKNWAWKIRVTTCTRSLLWARLPKSRVTRQMRRNILLRCAKRPAARTKHLKRQNAD